jgi:hypothetical protein
VRYERDGLGELVHPNLKKLGRIQRVGHRIHGIRRGKARGQGWVLQSSTWSATFRRIRILLRTARISRMPARR